MSTALLVHDGAAAPLRVVPPEALASPLCVSRGWVWGSPGDDEAWGRTAAWGRRGACTKSRLFTDVASSSPGARFIGIVDHYIRVGLRQYVE